eukprot:6209537-Pleurochrysis_carterae.AAC.1
MRAKCCYARCVWGRPYAGLVAIAIVRKRFGEGKGCAPHTEACTQLRTKVTALPRRGGCCRFRCSSAACAASSAPSHGRAQTSWPRNQHPEVRQAASGD